MMSAAIRFQAHHAPPLPAYILNEEPLAVADGVPLRTRAECQLNYKQAKYIARIDRVECFDDIQGGKGDWWPGI